MIDCLSRLNTLLSEEKNCVLITVAHTAGSAPREAGTKMIVAEDEVYGTIGGGNLENTAIQTARSFLSDTLSSRNDVFLEVYALGPMLEQCCGGAVFLQYEHINQDNSDWVQLLAGLGEHAAPTIVVTHGSRQDSEMVTAGKLIVTEFESAGSIGKLDEYAIEYARHLLGEPNKLLQTTLHSLSESKGALPDISDALLFDVLTPCDFNIVLFGAGHVGKAVIEVLGKSARCRVNWVDSRAELFPASLPEQVSALHAALPTNVVQELPADCYYLVMTHSHALDQALCEAILKRGDFRFLGLIGSETKKRRFHKRFSEKGFTEQQLQRLTCPIGIKGIESKEPGSIAISVVAQLLRIYESGKDTQADLHTNNVVSL